MIFLGLGKRNGGGDRVHLVDTTESIDAAHRKYFSSADMLHCGWNFEVPHVVVGSGVVDDC